MCGFLGEITSTVLEPTIFKNLLDLSKQRGPDHQSTWKKQNCQLGFNRLSILDISEAGNQPMMSPSGRYVLVFNGEIYNYKMLQMEYNIPSNVLRSTSDSEILCHLLDAVPIDEFVKKLNGMFAIAAWDTMLKQLTLVRDFSGIKPLYYGMQNEAFVFASQFNQVFKHPIFSEKKLRPDAMKSFFGFGFMQAPDTVFENIFQVEPGQLLVWDSQSKGILKKDYYYHWEFSTELKDSDLETKDVFKECLNQVIHQQMQSDVPLGTFLSSGYDSSLISAFAKHIRPDIKAFTFGVDQYGKFDERADSAVYAAKLDIDHITYSAKEAELLNIIDSHFADMPEPFGDYSSIPTYLISQKARQFAKVMLSGDGGDELFWGYPRFRTSLNNAHWFKYPVWFRKILLPILRRFKKKLPWGLQVYKDFSDWIMNKQMHFNRLDELVPNIHLPKSIYSLYNYSGSLEKKDILQYLKKNEFYGHMQRVLRKVDLMSMANSLEVRVPFLDKEMIAFSNRVDSGFTIHHNRAKLLLKESLYDFIPQSIVNTEKKGFSVPIYKWLRKELKPDLKNTLLDYHFYGAEFIDSDVLESVVIDFFDENNKGDVWGIWHLYAWQKWAISNDLTSIKSFK